MNTFYLICFVLGLALSVLAAFAGGAHLHIGHFHIGHFHLGGHAHPPAGAATGNASSGLPFLNGFTLPAFLCWLGAAGYRLERYSAIITPLVLLLATGAGLVGASLFYGIIAKLVVPAERVLTAEDTRMDGVVARVSDAIRPDGIGEILYTQTGARRSAAARSETGLPIPRGTEVVVLRYDRGVAYVSPLAELAPTLNS